MNRPKIFQQSKEETPKQPVACPWVVNQPYPSSLSNKNRNVGQKRNSNIQTNNGLSNHWVSSIQLFLTVLTIEVDGCTDFEIYIKCEAKIDQSYRLFST